MGNEITKATMDVVGNCVATRIAVMRKELGDEEVEYSEEYQHLVDPTRARMFLAGWFYGLQPDGKPRTRPGTTWRARGVMPSTPPLWLL